MSTIARPSTLTGPTTPPPSTGPRPWRITRDEYYLLGEQGYFDVKRVELIRGEVMEMSPINIAHARGVGFVTDALTVAVALGHFLTCNNRSWCRVARPVRNRNRMSP